MDERLLILTNRRFLYAFFSRAFCDEPDEAFIAVLESDHLDQEVALIEDDLSDPLAQDLERARSFVSPLSPDGQRSLSALKGEFTRIFIGPGTLQAYPWESMHTTGKRSLFLPEVLEVRDAYRQAGYLPARYPAVSDDFIGLELDFMNKLAEDARAAFEAGNEESCYQKLECSQKFLEEHLLQWIDKLAQSIEENYGDCFYAALTELTALFLKRDAAILNELLNEK